MVPTLTSPQGVGAQTCWRGQCRKSLPVLTTPLQCMMPLYESLQATPLRSWNVGNFHYLGLASRSMVFAIGGASELKRSAAKAGVYISS